MFSRLAALALLTAQPPFQTQDFNNIGGGLGEQWLRQRKLAVTHVFAKRRVESFEPLMLDALRNHLGAFARGGENKVVDLRRSLTFFAAEFILRLTLGDDADDIDVKEALDHAAKNNELLITPTAWDAMPVLGKIPPFKAGREAFEASFEKSREKYRRVAEKRLKALDMDAEPRDHLDIMLQNVKRGSLTMTQVLSMLEFDFFLAGTDTSTSSMEWFFANVFDAPPEKLARIHEELDALDVPKTSLLTQADLTPEKVPYLYASLKETFRCVTGVRQLRVCWGQDRRCGVLVETRGCLCPALQPSLLSVPP